MERFSRFQRDVLAALEEDSKFDLEGALAAFDRDAERVVNEVVVLAFSKSWHGRLELRSRDRIRHMAGQVYGPQHEPQLDALEQQREGYREITGSAAEAANAVPTVIRAPGPGVRVVDTRDDRSQDHVQPVPSVVMHGGKPDLGGEAA